VRVPDEASIGKAKVTLTFPDWKDGKVAAVTIQVPIVDAPPKPENCSSEQRILLITQWSILA
jgi:hypothetical protein